MAKRNPVVRDLIARPPRGAGKHRDRRSEVQKRDADRETKNIFAKTPHKGFFYANICLRSLPTATLKEQRNELSKSW